MGAGAGASPCMRERTASVAASSRGMGVTEWRRDHTVPEGTWSTAASLDTGAPVLKAQHPDFETWSQGIHADNGVTCADCHMAYQRDGAAKVSNHQVASPMLSDETINASCLTCHSNTEQQMRDRVAGIHTTYEHTKDVAFDALTALIYDIEAAQKDGRFKDEIVPVELKAKYETTWFDTDEHPRETSLDKLAKLKPFAKTNGVGTIQTICY